MAGQTASDGDEDDDGAEGGVFYLPASTTEQRVTTIGCSHTGWSSVTPDVSQRENIRPAYYPVHK